MNPCNRCDFFLTRLTIVILGILTISLWGAEPKTNQTSATSTSNSQKAPNGAAVTYPGTSGKTRLFIFSGQSNMVGLKPNTTVMPFVRKAFPDDELVAVTVAEGGKPIRLWYKSWKDANGKESGLPQGELYDRLLAEVQVATKDKHLHSLVFLWMQGETDGREANSSEVYEKSLTGLIQQMRTDLKRTDLGVVLGRISDCKMELASWKQIRKVQETVATADPRARWFDTDDLNGPRNEIHYTNDGYVELGKRFAEKAIELLLLPSIAPPKVPRK